MKPPAGGPTARPRRHRPPTTAVLAVLAVPALFLAAALATASPAPPGSPPPAPASLPQSTPTHAAQLAGCLRDPACPDRFVAAHRGGNAGPDNSRQAIRRSLEWGVPILEIDLRLSADGDIYVLHDSTLDRTTNLRGAIQQTPSRELARAYLANGEPLPTFADLYRLVDHRALLDLHILDQDAIPRLAAWLAAEGTFDDTIVFLAGPDQAAAAAPLKRAHPEQLVMLRADNRAQFEAGARLLGATPEITHVGYFAHASFLAYLRRRGTHIWANALGFERLPGPLRALALRANLAHADIVQTDDPRCFLADVRWRAAGRVGRSGGTGALSM